MKNRILFMLCVLVVAVSLIACDDEKPYEDTEIEKEPQTKTEVEDIGGTEDQNKLMFYEFTTAVVKVELEDYNAMPQGLFLTGIIENETEWKDWSRAKAINASYNTKMWDTNLLLVFSFKGPKSGEFDIQKIKALSYDGEDIRVTDSVTEQMEFEFSTNTETVNVVYQFLWVKRSALKEITKIKYDVNHLYMVDEDDAYRIYLSLKGSYINVAHSEDGGNTWNCAGYGMDEISGTGSGEIMAAFLDENTAYLLYTSDAALGHMNKKLYYMGDADRYIIEVIGDTTTIDNYPVDMDFYNKDIGYIITNYHNSTNFIYRTEDGGQTWKVMNAPEIEAEYLYVEGYEIECISEKQIRLVVQIVNSQRKYREEFYSHDGGQHWGERLWEYESGIADLIE